MNSAMNEQFEKWRKEQIASLVRTGHIEAARAFQQLGSIHWMAWQSSRAAIEVTLPARASPFEKEIYGVEFYSMSGEGRNKAIEECRAALEAQGIRVK